MEEAGFMTYNAASQQGAIKMILTSLWGLSVFIYPELYVKMDDMIATLKSEAKVHRYRS